MRENSRNSVRRPRCASLTRRNYGGFCLPGNRPGLSGLHGGGCRNELMAIARFVAANVKVARGQTEGANYKSLFARKPQISLAFVPLNSNGRDVLKGAQAPAGVTRR